MTVESTKPSQPTAHVSAAARAFSSFHPRGPRRHSTFQKAER